MSVPNVARQYPLSVFIDIVFGDLPTTAVGVAVAEIPQGSVITFIQLFITTAWSAGGNYDAEIGDADDDDRYTATISELDATGLPTNPPAITGYKTLSGDPDLEVTPVFTVDATAGAARLLVEYLTSGRNNENRG